MTKKTKGWAAYAAGVASFVGAAQVAGDNVMTFIILGFAAIFVACIFIDEAAKEASK